MYALNLAEDGRVLSATDPKYAPADAVTVEALPEGNIADYIYRDGQFSYGPRPKKPVYPAAPRNLVGGEYVTVNGTLYKATVNIPVGEKIITGHNATETTIEEQFAELAKGE